MGLLSSARRAAAPGPAEGTEPSRGDSTAKRSGLFDRASLYAGNEKSVSVLPLLKERLDHFGGAFIAVDAVSSVLKAFLPGSSLVFLVREGDEYHDAKPGSEVSVPVAVVDGLFARDGGDEPPFVQLGFSDSESLSHVFRGTQGGKDDRICIFRLTAEEEAAAPLALIRLPNTAQFDPSDFVDLVPQLSAAVRKGLRRETSKSSDPRSGFREKLEALIGNGTTVTIIDLDLTDFTAGLIASGTVSSSDTAFDVATEAIGRSVGDGFFSVVDAPSSVLIIVPSAIDAALFVHQLSRSLASLSAAPAGGPSGAHKLPYRSLGTASLEDALSFIRRQR